jgi:hypothetical protein
MLNVPKGDCTKMTSNARMARTVGWQIIAGIASNVEMAAISAGMAITAEMTISAKMTSYVMASNSRDGEECLCGEYCRNGE